MENYGRLAQIVEATIDFAIDEKKIPYDLFFRLMEKEFGELGFRGAPPAEVTQKILILRLDAVGDFILTTPAIRAIRENFSNAFITLAVTKEVYPLAELCPYVNEVIVFETEYQSTVQSIDMIQIFETATIFSARYLWRRKFDACFSFMSDPTSCVMSYVSGAKIRVGPSYDISGTGLLANFPREMIGKFFTHPTFIDHEKVVHFCEKNLQLLSACGIKTRFSDLELWHDFEDVRRAQVLMKNFAQGRIKIALGIGANLPARKYPVEKYLVALKEIISRGAAVVILGGKNELNDAKFLEENLPAEYVKNFVKVGIDWRTTIGIISLTDIYIGNDTGAKHVAAALKKPVVMVSRESKDRERALPSFCEHLAFAPYRTKFIILQPEHQLGDCADDLKISCRADKPHCITQIEPLEIVSAYEKILR
ncbi:MAG: glycosyltransferase family 9 protein [Selenomonadaceae bacterium]|nr:glycosyltransferase family 9 protein [Selenomonadaceae bacterium]